MARKTDGSALIKGPDSTEPALLMRMAMGPRAASAAVTCRLTSTTSVTSATPHPAASPAATASRGAGAGERGGDRAADATPAAGHESMLARKRHGLASGRRKGIAAGPAYFKLKILKLQACPSGYFKPKINPAARRAS